VSNNAHSLRVAWLGMALLAGALDRDVNFAGAAGAIQLASTIRQHGRPDLAWACIKHEGNSI